MYIVSNFCVHVTFFKNSLFATSILALVIIFVNSQKDRSWSILAMEHLSSSTTMQSLSYLLKGWKSSIDPSWILETLSLMLGVIKLLSFIEIYQPIAISVHAGHLSDLHWASSSYISGFCQSWDSTLRRSSSTPLFTPLASFVEFWKERENQEGKSFYFLV